MKLSMLLVPLLAGCVTMPATPDDHGNDPVDAGDQPPDPVDAGRPADAALPEGELGPPWKLIWRDEFDGEAGAYPDSDKWVAEIGGHGWGNEQLEFNTDRAANASKNGQGHLAITARREQAQSNQYTSARLISRGKFERRYGRFEARMKMPKGQGLWPAFWLLGADIGSVGWPACGEIDIMEYRGQDVRALRGSLHGPGYSAGGNHGKEIDTTFDLSADFHTYAVEWDPGRIVWKLDERVYFSAVPQDLPPGVPWVFDHTFFMILNVAVGGNFVGPVGNDVQFPQTMLVDHVRVYERMP
jgi:beta-glucanase (GH16 family)